MKAYISSSCVLDTFSPDALRGNYLPQARVSSRDAAVQGAHARGII
jgi:hypothetical protein